jgi:hypothetical protein
VPAWSKYAHASRPECCIRADLNRLAELEAKPPPSCIYFRKHGIAGQLNHKGPWHIARAHRYTVCGLPIDIHTGGEITQEGACAEHAPTLVCNSCARMAGADSVILATTYEQVRGML